MELREHGRKHEGDQQQRWSHRLWQTPTSNTGVELSLPSFGTAEEQLVLHALHQQRGAELQRCKKVVWGNAVALTTLVKYCT